MKQLLAHGASDLCFTCTLPGPAQTRLSSDQIPPPSADAAAIRSIPPDAVRADYEVVWRDTNVFCAVRPAAAGGYRSLPASPVPARQ